MGEGDLSLFKWMALLFSEGDNIYNEIVNCDNVLIYYEES